MANSFSPQDIALALSQGNLVVMRTDTIYGILALASNPKAVEKLYSVKKRDPRKPCILLVTDSQDIPISQEERQSYQKLSQERPTTLVTPVDDSYLPHLPRNNGTLAFRAVNLPELQEIVRLCGPVLAPSANPEGLTPATNISQAKNYFGDKVSLYIDGGEVPENTPSRIVKFVDGAVQIIR